MIHPHRILQNCLIKQHLHLIILFRFHFSANRIFVSLSRFHFDERRHIALHIVEPPLQAERFTYIRRFEHGIRLVQFVAGGMKSIIHRLTDMIKMEFAVIKELTFLLPITQVGTSSQFNRITYPLIEEKVGYIS